MRQFPMPSDCGCVPRLMLVAISLIIGCSDPKSDVKKTSPSSAVQDNGSAEASSDSTSGSSASSEKSEAVGAGDNKSTSDRKASDSPLSQRSKRQQQSPPSQIETIDSNTKSWIDSTELGGVQWELQFLKNAPVGYVKQSYLPTEDKDPDRLWIEMENKVWLERDTQRIEQSLQVRSLERVNGRLEKLVVTFKVGSSKVEVDAIRVGSNLEVTRTTDDRSVKSIIPWQDHYGGPFAIEQSLRRKPILTKETRKLAYYDPILNEVIEVELSGGQPLNTPMLDGRLVRLLEVQVELRRGDQVLRNLLWVDDQGVSQKTYSGAMDIRTFRCSEAVGQTIKGKGSVDMIADSSIPLKEAIVDGDTAKSITYRIQIKDGREDPYKYFSKRTNQSIRSKDPQTAEVTVHQISAGLPIPEGIEREGVPEDSMKASTGFLQSEELSVLQMAKKFTEAESQDRPIHERWALGVFHVINKKDFSKSIFGAGEVAMRMEGDCTANAILLAAIARSQGVHSRLACGVVYSDSDGKPSLKYHTWTEVWVDDRWIPLDPFQSQVPMPPTRLKVLETEIEKDDPYSSMLHVLTGIKDLEIEVVKIDR